MEGFFYLELNREVQLITFYILFTFISLIPELLEKVGSVPLIDEEILLWCEITTEDHGEACTINFHLSLPGWPFQLNGTLCLQLYIYIFLNKISLCTSNSNTEIDNM